MKSLVCLSGLLSVLCVSGVATASPRPSRFVGSYEAAMQLPVQYDFGAGASGGGLDANELQSPLNAALPAITRCVAQESARGGQLTAVPVRVVVAHDGRAIGVSVDQGSAAFRACVTTVVRRARWHAWNGPRMAFSWGFELQ